jgi:GDP-L-fucose synthase
MLGSSIVDAWNEQRPGDELIGIGRADADLRDRTATLDLVRSLAPDAIIHAAAVVGGIGAKLAHPTKYLLENLLLDSSLISAAIECAVPELLYIGSAAVYPEVFPQPMREDAMLAGAPEPANEGYAIAKIAATKLCTYASTEFGLTYRVAVPSNLYGPNDNFSPSHSHLIAAALGKTHAALVADDPAVEVWGDGTARREFTFAVDLSEWLVGQIGQLDKWPAMLNLGAGTDHSISEFYEIARRVVGFRGELHYDTDKPAGAAQRLLDSTAARSLGWSPKTSMESGMAIVYRSFLAAQEGQHTS